MLYATQISGERYTFLFHSDTKYYSKINISVMYLFFIYYYNIY